MTRATNTTDQRRKRISETVEHLKSDRAHSTKPGHPCPICGDIGGYCRNGLGLALCAKVSDGAELTNLGLPWKVGKFGWIHVLDGDLQAPLPPASIPRARPPKPKASPAELADRARFYALQAQDRLGEAARELGLPIFALRAFGLGAGKQVTLGSSWTWTEHDSDGSVIGIGYRQIDSGQKRAKGGRGIILATEHAQSRRELRQAIIAAGRVVLPEGLTDSVAAHAMDQVTVGRYSASGGIELIAELLESLELPADVEVVVPADNDTKPDGRQPGRDGAMETAQRVADRLGREVATITPREHKDIRAAWVAGVRIWEQFAQLCDSARITPSLPPNNIDCPCSSLGASQTLRTNRDKRHDEAPIRHLFKGHPPWPKPSQWDCPHAFGVPGRSGTTPVVMAATCGSRSCPACGPRWKTKTFHRFESHILAHLEQGGRVFAGYIDPGLRGAMLKQLRRDAKSAGESLQYVTIRQDNGQYAVFSSRPGEGLDELAPEVLGELLIEAVDEADQGPRPVAACRSWGVVRDRPEVERLKNQGSCSRTAFSATCESWGTSAVGRGRIVSAASDGLFADADGELDERLERVFWMEAVLRDIRGDAAGDGYHDRIVEPLLADRRSPAPPPPGPDPPDQCDHPPDQVCETRTHDGFINRQCQACGSWLRCRPAVAV